MSTSAHLGFPAHENLATIAIGKGTLWNLFSEIHLFCYLSIYLSVYPAHWDNPPASMP